MELVNAQKASEEGLIGGKRHSVLPFVLAPRASIHYGAQATPHGDADNVPAHSPAQRAQRLAPFAMGRTVLHRSIVAFRQPKSNAAFTRI